MLTSTSVPTLTPSVIRPYLVRTVPYYLVTVVQPYSEDVAPSSFNYNSILINGIVKD